MLGYLCQIRPKDLLFPLVQPVGCIKLCILELDSCYQCRDELCKTFLIPSKLYLLYRSKLFPR